jgi:magnesium transporter
MPQQRRLDFGSAHWLDLTDASESDLKELCKNYGLTEAVAADCLDPSQLPKVQRLEKATFLMLRSFDEKSTGQASTAQAVTRKVALLWGENFLVTIHRAEMPWLNDVWSLWERRAKREPNQLLNLVHDLIEDCIYTYERPIDDATEAVEELEDKIFAERSTRVTSSTTLSTAYLVKKRVFTIKRLIRLTRDLLPFVSKLGDPGSPAVQSLKEEADRLFFYSDDLVESANDLIQLSISMSSNRMNELVRLLTILSIFLLPLNVVTGIYGMNFDHMPELKEPYAYWAVLGVMLSFIVVVYVMLRRRGWIRANSNAVRTQR